MESASEEVEEKKGEVDEASGNLFININNILVFLVKNGMT